MTEVVLVNERSGADSRRIWASLNAEGSLVISGQDIGPAVERIFGSDEYEFSHTISAACLEEFFAILGLANFEDVLGAIRQFGGRHYDKLADSLEIAKETMPIKFWSRH